MTVDQIKQQVKWKDLVQLNTTEKIIENTLCLPWIVGALVLAYYELYVLALPCSALYFLTALRQSHNGYHSTLGVGKLMTQLTLHLNSVFMLASLHAIRVNHIKHHEDCLQAHDYEKTVADMPWWRALLHGPSHWWHNHIQGFKMGTPQEKKLIQLELILVALLVSSAVTFHLTFLLYHIGFMILAEMLMPFFTVWMSHHGHDEHSIAKPQRNKLLNTITMNMLLHLEHHIFPAVPAIKLGELAKRFDEVKMENQQ